MCACALIACSGANGSASPYAAAVPGMNCAMPCAPAPDCANGLKFDSAYSWAASSADDTFQRCAASLMIGAYWAGTKLGTAPCDRPAAPSPVAGLGRDCALRTY